MDRARAVLRRYADDADAALAALPATSAREALRQLCDFMANRTG